MNAVATKPRAETKAAEQPKDHAGEMRQQLREVDRLLSMAWDACEESSNTEALLEHLVSELLPDTMMALKADELHQGIVRQAHDDLWLPLALLETIAMINAGTVLHHTLHTAWTLLNEVHNGLDQAGWSKVLPVASRAEILAPPPAADTEVEERLELARETNHEIAKLAEGMVRLLELRRDDDFLMYHGILQRIALLSEINFFAMSLHGEADGGRDQWGDCVDVVNMKRAYKGFYR